MLGGICRRLTFANVMSVVAVFLAIGGTSIAAVSLKRNSVRSSHIKNEQVRSVDVRDGSLLAGDFAAGQLPAGARGPEGPTGPRGPEGSTGAPGLSGREIVQAFSSVGTATSATSTSTVAACPEGKSVIGGGHSISTNGASPPVTVMTSRPRDDSQDWFAFAKEYDASWVQAWSLNAYAVCATVAP